MTDQIMPCPVKVCTHEAWVPPGQDDDAYAELWTHVARRHEITGDAGSVLMTTVEVVERPGGVTPACPFCRRVICICT